MTDPVGKMVPDKRLHVTAEDIERGEARDQWNCAIAETVKREIPLAVRVRVNRETISYTLGEERITYPTPVEAVEAVIKPFDEGVTDVKPEPMLLRLRGGTARPVKHKEAEQLTKHRTTVRKYFREIRSGDRTAPPSVQPPAPSEDHPNSRTWNRFVDQSKRGQA